MRKESMTRYKQSKPEFFMSCSSPLPIFVIRTLTKQTWQLKDIFQKLKGFRGFFLFLFLLSQVILNIKAYQKEDVSENDKMRLLPFQSLTEIWG